MINILLTQRIFPYYRYALFKELLFGQKDICHYTLTFGNDNNNHAKSTPCFTSHSALPEDLRDSHQIKFLKNIYLPFKFLVQPELLELVIDSTYSAIIFEACPFYLTTWIGAFIARLLRKKVLFWGHGFKRNDKGPIRFLRLLFYRLPSCLLVYGSRGRYLCEQSGISGNRIIVVNNSLDIATHQRIREETTSARLAEIRSSLFRFSVGPILIWVGRLTAARRLELLLEAGMDLHSRGYPVNILFVGDGQQFTYLRTVASKLELDKFTFFYGPCYEEEKLGPLFLTADILVSPGPIGLSCIHAHSYGLPVITNDDLNTQGPEVDVIVPGRTGDFFRKGDRSDLVDKITKWIKKIASGKEHQILCHQQVQRYSPEHQASLITAAAITTNFPTGIRET